MDVVEYIYLVIHNTIIHNPFVSEWVSEHWDAHCSLCCGGFQLFWFSNWSSVQYNDDDVDVIQCLVWHWIISCNVSWWYVIFYDLIQYDHEIRYSLWHCDMISVISSLTISACSMYSCRGYFHKPLNYLVLVHFSGVCKSFRILIVHALICTLLSILRCLQGWKEECRPEVTTHTKGGTAFDREDSGIEGDPGSVSASESDSPKQRKSLSEIRRTWCQLDLGGGGGGGGGGGREEKSLRKMTTKTIALLFLWLIGRFLPVLYVFYGRSQVEAPTFNFSRKRPQQEASQQRNKRQQYVQRRWEQTHAREEDFQQPECTAQAHWRLGGLAERNARAAGAGGGGAAGNGGLGTGVAECGPHKAWSALYQRRQASFGWAFQGKNAKGRKDDVVSPDPAYLTDSHDLE